MGALDRSNPAVCQCWCDVDVGCSIALQDSSTKCPCHTKVVPENFLQRVSDALISVTNW